VTVQTEVRGAREHDYPAVRRLLAAVWSNPDDELGIWDHLTASDPSLEPEWVRLVVAGGQVVACTVLLPRPVRGRQGWVDGAELTLVATHPDHRLRGHGAAVVRDALGFLAARGRAIAVFYGVPGFYPRFGCAPVIPTLRTELPALEAAAPAPAEAAPALAEATAETLAPADLETVNALYMEQVAVSPCSAARTADAWMWTVRNREAHRLWILRDGAGRRAGYAFASLQRDKDRLLVREGGAVDEGAAGMLLEALRRETASHGLAGTHLAMAPGHPLTRLALLAGAQQHYFPAEAGFVAVTRWKPLLPAGYTIREAGGPGSPAGSPTDLIREGRVVLSAPRPFIVQLVLGYRDIDDILLAAAAAAASAAPGAASPRPACAASPRPEDLERLRRDFPRDFPKYTEAPYFFWF